MNITRIFYFLISAVFGIVFYIQYQLFLRIDNINNSIENLKLKNDEKLADVYKLVFESHFKDDLVLSGFNISTAIIIAFFTALIALGTFFSFKKIDEEIKELKKLKQEVEDAKSKIDETSTEVKDTKSKIEKISIDVQESNTTTKKWITETRFTFKEYSYESNLILADINFNQKNIPEFIRLKKRGILDLFDCINYILQEAYKNNEKEKVNIPIENITLQKEISNLINNYHDKLNSNDIKLWEEEVIYLLPISSPAIKNDFIELLKIINNK